MRVCWNLIQSLCFWENSDFNPLISCCGSVVSFKSGELLKNMLQLLPFCEAMNSPSANSIFRDVNGFSTTLIQGLENLEQPISPTISCRWIDYNRVLPVKVPAQVNHPTGAEIAASRGKQMAWWIHKMRAQSSGMCDMCRNVELQAWRNTRM